MTKQNGVQNWLKQNAWNLLITGVAVIAAATLLNYRITKAEEKIATYPSREYFDLRFDTIEQNLNDVKVELRNHINK